MGARIVGWGHTKFGRLEDNLEQLIVKAAKEAIEHAGIDPTDVDGIWLGHYNGGLVSDGFPSSLRRYVVQAHPLHTEVGEA